jgi:hypothetical protein
MPKVSSNMTHVPKSQIRPFRGGDRVMLRKIIALTFLTLFVISASAESQPPIPIGTQHNNNNPAEGSKEQSNEDKYSCESLRTLLKEIISQYQNQNIKNIESQEHHWYNTFMDNTTNWLLVLFNLLLVVVTGLLVLYNYRLWKATKGLLEVSNKQWDANIRQMMYTVKHNARALRANERAADAAKDSADALPAIERAYLFVKITMDNPNYEGIAGTIDKEPQYNMGNVKIIVTNRGKTAALITGFHIPLRLWMISK